MSTLDPASEAALSAPVVTVAGLLRIDFSAHTMRLCDGSAEIPSGVDIYTGEDALFGVLSSISAIDSGMGDNAPAIDVAFLPKSGTALASISSPAFQGSRVRTWVAVIDQLTGTIVGAAQQIFFGLIDTCEVALGKGMRAVKFQCVSGFERLFANQEGQRLADTFHQNIWPSELGLTNVTGITIRDAWGTNGPPPANRFASGGSGGGRQTDVRDL